MVGVDHTAQSFLTHTARDRSASIIAWNGGKKNIGINDKLILQRRISMVISIHTTESRTSFDRVKHRILVPVILAVLACASIAPGAARTPLPSGRSCIPSGDETAINAALTGPGATAMLCPHAVFEIANSIVLSADGQELATLGSPSIKSQAVIRVAGGDLATAIYSRASNINIHHIVVDGARAKFGRLPTGGALLEIGGDADDVLVDHVRALDPRGWSTLHVDEGELICRGARITNNVIGPAGAPNGEWADGISFSCRDGFVAHNFVIDASDGGIVIFGSPGTIVEDNVIKTENNQLLGAINLVDFAPWNGNYSGTIVRNNRIVAYGGYIKVGIGMGPAVWGSSTGQVNEGATVEGNTIYGDNIGYPLAADGVSNFTVTGNRVLGKPTGALGPNCIAGLAPPGAAMTRTLGTTTGEFQSEFVAGDLLYAICIVP